jgi:hypothetical protein
MAGREKDIAFVAALFQHTLALPELVRDRLTHTEIAPAIRSVGLARLDKMTK